MIATTMDSRKCKEYRPNRLCCHFRLSIVVAIGRGQFLRVWRGRKPQFAFGISVVYMSRFQRYISGFAAIGYRPLSQSLGDTYRARHCRKCRICRWNFDAVSHGFRYISISGFGSHVAISGCRPLL